MSTIRDLKTEYDGLFTTGKFDSVSLFSGEMIVEVFTKDGATVADAERCIGHYNHLNENKEVCDSIQIKLEKFFLYMYNEWKAMGIYDDIAESLKPVMDGYKAGDKLIKYLYKPRLYVEPQLEGETGYGIECECPWEPEHQCMILIRNNKVVYAGPSDGLSPWEDEDAYYCIWNDDENK